MLHVAELLKEASKLDIRDRAELVSSLLEDLDPHPHYVSDEEAMQRLADLVRRFMAIWVLWGGPLFPAGVGARVGMQS